MTRLKGWEQRLAAYFKARAREPHVWGRNDCALFAAGAIEAMTGEDPGAPFRGQYVDEAGARRVLASLGCSQLAELPERMGLEPILPSDAQRGDLVFVEGRHGPVFAVQWLPAPVGPGPRGLTHIDPRDATLAAWRIG
jgi:hypothetical protein